MIIFKSQYIYLLFTLKNMFRTKQIYLPLLIIISFFLTSCISNGSKFIKNPEITEIRDFELVEVKDSFLTLTVTSIIKNENRIGGTVNKIMADIFIDGVKVGHIDEEKDFHINPNDTTFLTIPAKINLAQFSQLFPVLVESDSAVLQIKGLFSVDAIVSSIEFNRKTEKKIPIQSELNKVFSSNLSENAVKVEKIRVKNISISETNLDVDLRIKNSFSIDYYLQTATSEFFFPNKEEPFGSWSSNASILVKANETKQINGSSKIINRNALLQSISMVFSEKEAIIKGRAKIDINTYIFEFPFTQKIKLKTIL